MTIIKGIGKVIYNKSIARDCFRMRLGVKPPLGKIIPGQFIHLKLSPGFNPVRNVCNHGSYQIPHNLSTSDTVISNGVNPLLRRPFSIYEVSKDGAQIEILYEVVGVGTDLMARMKPGIKIDILGPLGNGFRINKDVSISILVGGGIGVAGLNLLVKRLVEMGFGTDPVRNDITECKKNITKSITKPVANISNGASGHKIYALIGAATREKLYILDGYKMPGVKTLIATEDGSAGLKGLVTNLLTTLIQNLKSAIRHPQSTIQIYTCGPAGMIDKVCKIVREKKVPCQVSLESRMGCGIGICRACVCKVQKGKSFGYAPVCTEGPVFEANQLVV